MKIAINVLDSYMEKILNEGLCVLLSVPASLRVGDPFSMHEMTSEGEGVVATGRVFFARATHIPFQGIAQFQLSPFMDAPNDDGVTERFPMTGSIATEAKQLPEDEWVTHAVVVTGEKPVWLYQGMKWKAEISIAKLNFLNDDAFKSDMAPLSMIVKIQKQGGEKSFVYGKLLEAEGAEQ
jgi:hypothetical protein